MQGIFYTVLKWHIDFNSDQSLSLQLKHTKSNRPLGFPSLPHSYRRSTPLAQIPLAPALLSDAALPSLGFPSLPHSPRRCNPLRRRTPLALCICISTQPFNSLNGSGGVCRSQVRGAASSRGTSRPHPVSHLATNMFLTRRPAAR